MYQFSAKGTAGITIVTINRRTDTSLTMVYPKGVVKVRDRTVKK
jgi:hypothetical protein